MLCVGVCSGLLRLPQIIDTHWTPTVRYPFSALDMGSEKNSGVPWGSHDRSSVTDLQTDPSSDRPILLP